MTAQSTFVHIRLRFLCLILALLAWVCMGTFASADPITPQQAVSEMTWGVNLTTLYMADKVYNENGGNSLGYCDQAPLGIGILPAATYPQTGIRQTCFLLTGPF